MGLLDLNKRNEQNNKLTTQQVDENWSKIEALFPTPASGNIDVGKTITLNSSKTGFDYTPLPTNTDAQTLSILGQDLSISGGNTVTLPSGGAETDPTVPAYAKTLTGFSVIKTDTDALYEPLFSKNTAFNKNFGTTSGTVVEGNDNRVLNGQTAFGWGNHALAGYQSLLVSGTNIKTINGNSVLGSGDLVIGGGSSFETKTKAEIDTLISTNALVVGTLYKITSVHDSSAHLGSLYQYPTKNGVDIFLTAIAPNKLSLTGHGIFYNTNRNTSSWNFGVWTNMVSVSLSSVVGTFTLNETVTADNGATGTYKSATYIQWTSGSWSTATSITGGTSGATANITYNAGGTYAVNDVVVWGGYAWKNLTGAIGSSLDDRNLDATNWVKLDYTDSNYTMVVDAIDYDYANNWIIKRSDRSGNEIEQTYEQNNIMELVGYTVPFHAIAMWDWGYPYSPMTVNAVADNKLSWSYVNLVNAWKVLVLKNKGTLYYVSGNIGNGYTLEQNNINQFTLTGNIGDTYEVANNSGNDYELKDNIGDNYSIFGNSGNTYHLNSNTGGNYNIASNSGSGYVVANNTKANPTRKTTIAQNNLNGRSSLFTSVNIHHNIMDDTLSFGLINNSGTAIIIDGLSNTLTLGGNIENTHFEAPTVFNTDLSGATNLKSSFSKTIYKRPDGTLRMRYYDNSDALVVANYNS